MTMVLTKRTPAKRDYAGAGIMDPTPCQTLLDTTMVLTNEHQPILSDFGSYVAQCAQRLFRVAGRFQQATLWV